MRKLIIVAAFSLLAAGCTKAEPTVTSETITPTTTQESQTEVQNQTTTSPEPKVIENVRVYSNTQYNFQITVPTGSTVEEYAKDIRIQNYVPDNDNYALKSNEYYLEINISAPEDLCYEITSPRNVTVSPNVKAIRGLGMIGGDAGGVRHSLCVSRNGNTFNLGATERSTQGLIANAILDSFKFTK